MPQHSRIARSSEPGEAAASVPTAKPTCRLASAARPASRSEARKNAANKPAALNTPQSVRPRKRQARRRGKRETAHRRQKNERQMQTRRLPRPAAEPAMRWAVEHGERNQESEHAAENRAEGRLGQRRQPGHAREREFDLRQVHGTPHSQQRGHLSTEQAASPPTPCREEWPSPHFAYKTAR